MNTMITIWAVIYIVGLSLFYLLALFIIPAGYKDLQQLLSDLRESPDEE